MTQERRGEARATIEQAWREISDFDAQHHPNRLAPDAPRFIDYAWKKFDAKTVLTVLTSEQPTYKALKPILFSGLCTWVVCPERKSLRRHGMLLVGIEHLRAAEVLGRAAFGDRNIPNHDLLGDIFGRLRALGQDFYNDFYYPIGGLAQVLRSTTPSNFAQSVANHTKDVRIVVAMMQVFDFHAKHLNDTKRYYKASDSKGYELIREIHGVSREEIGIGLDKIEEIWRGLKETAAIIYAASTIPGGKNESLLDAICAGTADYEEHGHLLKTWIGLARYAAESILGKSTKPDVGRINAAWLPDLPPEPNFSKAEQARIESEFDMVAILGARQPGERRMRLSRRGPRKV